MPRSSTSATSRRGSARSRRTWRWRSSAARPRPTSGSRWTCAARSCRPPTRAPRGRSRSARRWATCARAGSTPRSPAAVEIPLSPLAFGAFDIIRALSAGHNDDPGTAERPFDVGRDGFVMGEGAALLVLEAAEVAEARGAVPYAELLGYGATSDAHHMVQPRADGTEAARAATIALDDAGVDPGEIDYVNAHASSTPIGDVAEARAIALALGERAATVPVSGTKALYGHPLGASGAIEAAICALAIRDGWAPASVNLFEPDPDVAALLPGLLREGRDGTLSTGPVDLVRVRRAQRRAGLRRRRGLRPRTGRGRRPGISAVARRPPSRLRPEPARHGSAQDRTSARKWLAIEAVPADPGERPDADERPTGRPPIASETATPKNDAMPPISGPPTGVEPAKIVV